MDHLGLQKPDSFHNVIQIRPFGSINYQRA
jgi:hypothetical protein